MRILESYGRNIEQQYKAYSEEQLELNMEQEKEVAPLYAIPF